MSITTEEDVLSFIKDATAPKEPTVSLTLVRQAFAGTSREVLKIHLGKLYRTKKIDRQDGVDGDVLYWTPATAEAAVRSGAKSSRTAKAGIAPTLAASNPLAPGSKAQHWNSISAPVSSVPARPITEVTPAEHTASELAAQAQVAFATPLRGALQRQAITGLVANALFHHPGQAWTVGDVMKMLPHLLCTDIKRVLGTLSTRTDRPYVRRILSKPPTYTWSGVYDNPFLDTLPSDATSFFRQACPETVVPPITAPATAQPIAPPVTWSGDTLSGQEEKIVSAKLDSAVHAASDDDTRQIALVAVAAPETLRDPSYRTDIDNPWRVAAEQDAPGELLQATERPEDNFLTDAEVDALLRGVVNDEDDADATTSTDGTSILPPSSFDASLNLAGCLTLTVDDVCLVLDHGSTQRLITLLGPHHRPEHHRI